MAKRVVILGAGESGVGAALLAKQKGCDVFVSDYGKIKTNYKNELVEAGILFEEEEHSDDSILNADIVIKSPGIPEKSEIIQKLRNSEISIISEIEFAYRYTNPNAKTIAITGSNGKTTTTTLIYYLLVESGLKASLCGNIGSSYARAVAEDKTDYFVIEVSSFQLDDITSFKPNIAILLNITPDHLDRYNYDFELYIQSKLNINKYQTEEDHFIYCADDEVINNFKNTSSLNGKLYPFSIEHSDNTVAHLEENQLSIHFNKTHFSMSIYELGLQGKHNLYNSMAAGVATSILDLRKDNIRESLRDFKSLEHRLETVTKVSGIEFINDSKATNINSTWYALETMQQPTVWIAGGVDKGNEYEVLTELVKNKVRMIVCLGTQISKLHRAFGQHVDLIINSGSMPEAVKLAYHFAEKGDNVLLSPACASFDLFENYEDRGIQFKQAVRNL